MYLKFNSVEDVKIFVNICTKMETDVVAESGIYRVNGKSILGMFSLDLSKPVNVYCLSDCKTKLFDKWKVSDSESFN